MKYFLLLILNFFLILPADAAVKCPLIADRAYKATGQPAVYFITKQCTKRAFADSRAFFSYFKSWKDVRRTTNMKLLNRITKDKNYLITFQKPTSTTAQPTKPKDDEKITPQPSINDVFTSCPTTQEIQKIEQDFSINYMDSSPRTMSWSNYPYSCDIQTTNPTRLKVYNTIRYLQKINFSKPLPFTSGKSLYDFFTLNTVTKLTIENRLECDIYSSGYNNYITFGGVFSRWYPVLSGSNSCERVIIPANDPALLNDFIYHPLFSSELFVHEAQHAITGKMHTANGNDLTIDEMGGWAAQFYFNTWVALYSTNIDNQTKNLARNNAASILQTRFTNPCPSDATLKSVVNQITPNTCR